ncbi:transglycosylase SLT domain-containing protein [Sulfobacillus sp. DSM 109850]|uniref:Transglycosylase SLT domain-containing protein n=2 Tax=Sulfobacillus harzensis TaxID=2729629 RepID=A0A7Y0Q3U6_9FIRM|nr:transglycosylase SLT domain-containing protein [Sulfobacillus harzensis]
MAAGPVAYGASLQQLQNQEAQAQRQLAAEEQQYNQTQKAIATTESEMSQLNNALAQAKQRIGSTSVQIAQTDHNIAVTQNLLNSTQAQLTDTEKQLAATTADYNHTTLLLAQTKRSLVHETNLLSGQLQLIEERGSVGYLDVILGAHSFSDFISRAQLLGQLAGQAAHEVNVIKREKAAYTLAQANLKREKLFLSQAAASIAQHKALLVNEQTLLAREREHAVVLKAQAQQEASQVSSGLAQRQQLYSQLQAQRAQLASGMAGLQSRIAGLVAQIQALLSQFNAGGMSRRALYNAMYPLVKPIGDQWGVPPALIIAVITQESGGNAHVVSVAGAVGLMQIEPYTAQDIAHAVGLSASTVDQELYNPEDNVELGTYYLHYLLGMFQGNTALAVAAYNAGPGAVQQYGGIPPYPQTQQYVRNVMALYALYSSY